MFENKIFERMPKYEILSKEQELELIARWKERGDTVARDKIILNNFPYIKKIIKSKSQEYKDDLIQVGFEALLDALNRFDVKKNVKFLTYARMYVRSYMDRYIMFQTYNVVREDTKEARKMYINGERKHNTIRIENDYWKDTVFDKYLVDHASLDKINTFIDCDIVTRELNNLSDRERYVIMNTTMKDESGNRTSEKLKISRERVRQIKNAALKKIRNKVLKNVKYNKREIKEISENRFR